MIKNISLLTGMCSSCIGRCSIGSNCMPFNIGPPIDNHVKPQEGFTYRTTEVMNPNASDLFDSFRLNLSCLLECDCIL